MAVILCMDPDCCGLRYQTDGVCRRRGILYRYQLQGYAKLIGVLKVIAYALLLNGVSTSSSLAQVTYLYPDLDLVNAGAAALCVPCA